MAIKQKNDLNNIIKPFFDLNFFFIIITIILFGLLILTSASIEYSSQEYDGEPFHYLFKQLGFLLFSIFVCSFFLYLSSENLKKNYKVFFYFFIFLLILGAIAGKTAGGSTRWLNFYGYTIQPSEFFKLFYIVWLCAYLDYNKNNIRRIEFFIVPILWFTVGAILLLLQPDFGSTAVLFFMTVLMLFIAKAKYIHLILSGIIGSLASVLVFVLNPYMVSRLDFFEPCQNGGYQLCWSLMAIGSGSVFGKGLGASTSKLLFLPEAHNDFIFAVLAEELGILGIIFIVLIFYLFFRKCFYIGNRALRVGLPFQGYLSYAIGIFITMQAFLHISVNLGLVPTKGLALPFFSYGGSNYLASMLSITIIFRIYRDVYKKSLNSSIR